MLSSQRSYPGSDIGFRGWGPRLGVSINPDQFHFGAHLDFGNFARHVRFQPNIELEHTLRHCRDMWFPRYLYRGEYQDDASETTRDQQMLDAAYQHYQEAIRRYTPPDLAPEQKKEIERIVVAARAGQL